MPILPDFGIKQYIVSHMIKMHNLPVMRLFGSNTSIFSSKSIAPADILGNLARNCCLGYCGSCLTYLRAFSLRRNPRLESSGEPISFSMKKENKAVSELNQML